MLEMLFKRKEKSIEKQQKGRANLAVSIRFLFFAYHLSVFLQTLITFGTIYSCTKVPELLLS